MSLSKIKVIDKIEILEDGVFQIREAIRVFDDDGSLIGERYNRTILVPGQDVSNWPLRLQKISNAVWTAQVIADYQAKVAAANANQGI